MERRRYGERVSLPCIKRTDANWPGTKAWIESKIAAQAAQLELRTMNHDDTQFTRGAIAQMRALLAEIEPALAAKPPNR